MNEFAILTNRRRTVIALAHSTVFLAIAIRQFATAAPAQGLSAATNVSIGTWILSGIYLVVSLILLYLVSISRGLTEKAYFALCASSAVFGLLRTATGDQVFHFALYLRIVMLAGAVLVGCRIARSHSEFLPNGS